MASNVQSPSEFSSAEYNDPHCDECYNDNGCYVKVNACCETCHTFLCETCEKKHEGLEKDMKHKVFRGQAIPKCQRERPVPCEFCARHLDMFCKDHACLVCSVCAKIKHKNCSKVLVPEFSYTANMNELKMDIVNLKQDLLSSKENIDTMIRNNLEKQRATVLKQSQQMFDDFVAKMDRLKKQFKAEVDEFYDKQSATASKQINEIDRIVASLDIAYRNVQKIENKYKYADKNLFIRMQDIVVGIKPCTDDFRKVQNSFQRATLTFMKNDNLHKTILNVRSLGTLKTSLEDLDTALPVADIIFPKFQENPLHVRMPVRSKSLSKNFRSFKDSNK